MELYRLVWEIEGEQLLDEESWRDHVAYCDKVRDEQTDHDPKDTFVRLSDHESDCQRREREAVDEIVAAIQAQCPACGGSGGMATGEHFVTREMALDAGEPAMEGMSLGVESEQCAYCGIPISAVRAWQVSRREKKAAL